MRFALVWLAALTAGCGGSYPFPQSEGPGPPATTKAPSVDIPALAREYQAIADKDNAAQDAIRAKSDASQITKAQQFVGVADAERQFATDLDTIKFPASMQADARDVSKASALYEQVLRNLAKATSPLEQSALLADFTKAKNELGAASDRLRRDLGLPPA